MRFRWLAATPQQGMVGAGARPCGGSAMCAHHIGVDTSSFYGTGVLNTIKDVRPEGSGGWSD